MKRNGCSVNCERITVTVPMRRERRTSAVDCAELQQLCCDCTHASVNTARTTYARASVHRIFWQKIRVWIIRWQTLLTKTRPPRRLVILRAHTCVPVRHLISVCMCLCVILDVSEVPNYYYNLLHPRSI